MEEVKSFRDLRTWQEAQSLVDEVYRLTTNFPREEIYGLTNQIRRAAVSVPSNIAEGMGRGSVKELIQFVIIARGSVHEVLSQLETAKRQGYLSLDDCEKISKRYSGLNAGLNAHLSTLLKYK